MPLDRASSASRQHFIDTGFYLRVGEIEEVDHVNLQRIIAGDLARYIAASDDAPINVLGEHQGHSHVSK